MNLGFVFPRACVLRTVTGEGVALREILAGNASGHDFLSSTSFSSFSSGGKYVSKPKRAIWGSCRQRDSLFNLPVRCFRPRFIPVMEFLPRASRVQDGIFWEEKYQGRIDGRGGSCIDALANLLHFWVLTRGSVGGRGSRTHASQNFPKKPRGGMNISGAKW